MTFDDVKDTVGKIAPAVATALGGPAAGQAASFVAGLLGVNATPEGIVAATENPEMAAKLAQIDADHKEKLLSLNLEAETKQLAEVNATMRKELESDNFWKSGWRGGIGWGFMLSLTSIAMSMAYNIAVDPTLAADDAFMSTVIWVVVTMGGALGINVRERTKDKMSLRGVKPSTFFDAIKKTPK